MKSPAASTSVTKQTTGTLQRVDLKGKFLFTFIFCFILVRYHEISIGVFLITKHNIYFPLLLNFIFIFNIFLHFIFWELVCITSIFKILNQVPGCTTTPISYLNQKILNRWLVMLYVRVNGFFQKMSLFPPVISRIDLIKSPQDL